MVATVHSELERYRRLLDGVKTIAVVGLSQDQWADSHGIAAYLQRQGFRIIPVNPKYVGQKILGEVVYPSLREVPVPVDVVDVFRRPEFVPPIAEDALAMSPRPRVFWMQVGIRNAEAAERLRTAGIEVVEDRCLGTVHRILSVN